MFDNRTQAGQALARALGKYAGDDVVVYALPRGGLPVAAAVASKLDAPLDVILVRKLGAPGHAEFAIGAVVDGAAPALILHKDVIRQLGVGRRYIEGAKETALEEIERRRTLYLKGRRPVSPRGKTAIVIDDGLATGATMEAAVKAMREAGAGRIVVAVPVAPADTVARLQQYADEVLCLETPVHFWSVGGHYRAFPQLEDADVVKILDAQEARSAVSENTSRKWETA